MTTEPKCDHGSTRLVHPPSLVPVCAKCGMRPEDIRIADLLRERDEARAEVKRLKDELVEAYAFHASAVASAEEGFDQRDALQQRLDAVTGQFEIQRDNYKRLLDAVYGGKAPDFECDPFNDAARNASAQKLLDAVVKEVRALADETMPPGSMYWPGSDRKRRADILYAIADRAAGEDGGR